MRIWLCTLEMHAEISDFFPFLVWQQYNNNNFAPSIFSRCVKSSVNPFLVDTKYSAGHYYKIIIINGTYKVQNLPRTQSAQRIRNTHKNYELGKAWRNKCILKWALNCKKLVMLPRLLGSKFQTVGAAKWNEPSPADLRLTREILSNFSEDERKTCGVW